MSKRGNAIAWIDAKTKRERPLKTGWQDDPERPGIQRYWSGNGWDDTIAPRPAPEPAWKGARVIAIGILAALGAVWFVVNLSQPSDLECATQRLEYATGDRPVYEVDNACR